MSSIFRILQDANAKNPNLDDAVETIMRGIRLPNMESWVEQQVADTEKFLRSLDLPRREFRRRGRHMLKTIKATARQAAKNARIYQRYDPEEIWGFRYLNTGDNIRPDHAALHGMTLPSDHEFWVQGFPPNGCNCKCTIKVMLRKPKRLSRVPPVDLDPAFAFNPGIQLSS